MKKVLVMLVLLAALMVGLILVRNRQEIRRGAAVDDVDVMFLPSSQEVSVGEQFFSTVLVDTKDAGFLGMEILVKYDHLKLRALAVETDPASTVLNFFNDDDLVYSEINQNNGTIVLACATSEEEVNNLPKGMIRFFRIKFEAIGGEQAEVGLDIGYDNVFVSQSGTNIRVLSLGNSDSAFYTIVEGGLVTPTLSPMPTGGTGNNPVLNFLVSFSRIRANAGDCVNNWKSTVMVLGGGETGVYENVGLTRDGVKVIRVGDYDVELARYRGSVRLTGFNHREGVAMFLKGPMHMQIKYGMDGQNSWYSRAGGELSLTNDVNTSPIYDFSAYPALAGDVTGRVEGVPDGILDGRDFSYVKSQISISRESSLTDEMVVGDFDGDCWVGNIDLAILMLSLQEKQSQLY